MSLLTADDRSRIAEIQARLSVVELSGPSAPASVLEPLRQLVGADQLLWHNWSWTTDGMRLGDFLGTHSRRTVIQPVVDRLAASVGRRFSFYDPVKPELPQRNRAVTRARMPKLSRNPDAAYVAIQESLGFLGDEMRALICDGDTFVCWVGGYSELRFNRRSVAAFNAVIPALQRRLTLERFLLEGELAIRGLEKALEEIPGAAFVVAESGRIRHLNTAGHAFLSSNPAASHWNLKDWHTKTRASERHSFSALEATGLPRHGLVVLRAGRDGPALAQTFSARMGLTSRECEVLVELCRGCSNKAIAALLGIAEKTVEQHVSRILLKTGSSSRAGLVAKAWQDG